MSAFGAGVSRDARAIAASAWVFRWKVEREAAVRFEALAGRMEAQGGPSHLAELARRAADDERRHARHCARLAGALDERLEDADAPPDLRPVAPSALGEGDALTYEVVAACCVAETVSVAVLTSLLAEARDDSLRAVLHELARDEVAHARLGWAWLAFAAARGGTAFLGPLLPPMLRGSVDEDLFLTTHDPCAQDELLALGVLPAATKRGVFVSALERVVFPGLEGAGVDTTAARSWLAARAAPPLAPAVAPGR